MSNRNNRIITVGGGKGGVGKSIVASNLAVAIAQMGQPVVLADLDLGAANQHLLLGLDQCPAGVRTLLEGKPDELKGALTPTAIPNLSLLAGTGAVVGAANVSHQSKLKLIRRLRALDAVVVIDVGAGVGYNALDFFLLGGQKLVVTTPQVTAIHDAYSFMKGAVLRMLRQQAETSVESRCIEPALKSGEGDKVIDVLSRLREENAAVADKVFGLLANFGAHLVGNQVEEGSQAGIFPPVARMMRDYLGIDVPVLGWLRMAGVVGRSVNEQRPLMLGRPSEQSRMIRQIAEALLAEDVSEDVDLIFDAEVDLELDVQLDVAAAEASEPADITIEMADVIPITTIALQPPADLPRRRRPITLPGMTPYGQVGRS
jgi:flagellar biosynthesis protein FlhG